MEIEELKTMWQLHENRLERTTRLNLHTLEMVQSHRAKSALKPLYVQNLIVLTLHSIVIIGLVLFILYHFSEAPYAISGLVLLGYYILLFINAYRQIAEINFVEQGNDVVNMQSALARLKTHMLDFMRLSVLTIPAFLSFPVVVPKALADLNSTIFEGFNIIEQTNGNWWLVEVIVFSVMIPGGIWFYKQVTPKNINKKWVRRIIEKASSKNVGKAVQYLNELEEIKAGKF